MTKRDRAKEAVNRIIFDRFNFDVEAEQKNSGALDDDFLLTLIGIDSIDVFDLEIVFEYELDCNLDHVKTAKTYGELIDLYENNLVD